MSAHRILAASVALICFAPSVRAVDIDDLRPGLVASYRDGKQPPVEVVRLEPGIALAWKATETAHPRLSPGDGTVQWEGYLNVLRAGNYRFSALLRGKIAVSVAGKEVLTGEGKEDAASTATGQEMRLEAGIHPLSAKFTRLPGAARLELFWQGPGFRKEPVPNDYLGHLPGKAPAKLATDRLSERGRFLAEERNCTSCHQPEKSDQLTRGLASRPGPDLSQVGGRAYAGWMYHWLKDPQKVRPGALMPRLFSEDESGQAEAYAVARYLSSLGGPVPAAKPPNPNEVKGSIASGQRLFNTVGCMSCHKAPEKIAEEPASIHGIGADTGVRQTFVLNGLGSKTTPDKLAAFLLNPHAIDPSGRMPNMLLEPKEATDLARHLCEAKDPAIAVELPQAPGKDLVVAAFKRLDPDGVPGFEKLGADAQLLDLGKRLTIEKGCVNCHTVAPDKKPLAVKPARAGFDGIKAEKAHAAGCLAEDAARRGAAPAFALVENDRKALRQFLSEGSKGAGSPAPAHAARLSLQRFNCLACHQRDGEGGLTTETTDLLRQFEKAENAEAVSPPPLTGVGHKLRTPWLKQVLTQRGRARPWMALRMPQFGDAQVGAMSESLAALEGTEPDDKIHKVPLNAAKIDAGKQLVGKNAFGCISCHDLAGIPNSGTRGPDLAGMNQRVRFDWYERWLEQAQRMQPGTRMPIVFPDGKSTHTTLFDGKADAQAEAMWAYLSLGPGLPLPEGIGPPKGLVLQVKDKPMLLRTFMPEAGARAIAIGYPGGISTAFDAQTCRLAYGWSGNFLDASPVWDNRGGAPAKLLGQRFWNAPAGCSWAVNDSNDPPDFAALRKDPAYGAAMPEGKVHEGPRQLCFDGYSTDKEGLPTFRYRLDAAEKHPVAVSERPEPLRNPVAFGLARRFTLQVPAQRAAWLLAGETTSEPRLLDAKGNPLTLDLKADRIELPLADRLLALPQGAEKVIVLTVTAAPKDAVWVLQKQGGAWQALVKVPAPAKESEFKVGLNVWSPLRDEPALLKEMLSAK